MRLFLLSSLAVLFLGVSFAGEFAVSPKEAVEMRRDNNAVILDVREDSEWNEHHIQGAIHIPLPQLKSRISELESFKNSPIITQCRSGRRSAQAQSILQLVGFSKVYNMSGGIQAWDDAGLSVDR